MTVGPKMECGEGWMKCQTKAARPGAGRHGVDDREGDAGDQDLHESVGSGPGDVLFIVV